MNLIMMIGINNPNPIIYINFMISFCNTILDMSLVLCKIKMPSYTDYVKSNTT